MQRAKVFLVGAGPGDPGLITRRGGELLERADVVLYDALVHPALLEHARVGAELRFVGKRYGAPSISQEEINGLLVELARAGRTVVRLKGGDPLLFARGAEELEALTLAGIPFEVVPGVPSPLAAAAYAGVPLTHRDLSSSVSFITGTESLGKPRSAHDWSRLACATHTVCIVMGMSRLAEIAAALVEHGRDPATPAAVVEWAAWPKQRVIVGTLADITRRAESAKVASPAVVIVGEVVRLREALRWYDRRPLFGKRVLVGRPHAQARDTAYALRLRGAEPVIVPLIETTPPPDADALDRAVKGLGAYDFVVFTSANGVAAAFDRIRALGLDARAFGRAKVAVIGPKTAEALRKEGIRSDVVAPEFRGESLAEEIQKHPGSALRRVLVLRAAVAREVLPEELRRAGAEVDVVPAYQTRPAGGEARARLSSDLEEGKIDVVLVTSSSSVEELARALGPEAPTLLRRALLASIGPVTTETATRLGLRVDVTASRYTVEGVLDALEEALDERPPAA